MQSETDGSGTESSWSLVGSDGDLELDFDASSISDHSEAPQLENPTLLTESDLSECDEDAIEYDCATESERYDEDENATDVEEINEISKVSSTQIGEIFESEEESSSEKTNDDAFCFTVDLRNERRVQIFAIGSVIAALLMAVVFRGPLAVHQLQYERLSHQEPIDEFAFADPAILHNPLQDYSRLTELPNEMDDLERCYQNLDETTRSASANSVLMRYMRMKNNRLESLLSELQTLVNVQKRELEQVQQKQWTTESRLLQPVSEAESVLSSVEISPCSSSKDIPPTSLPSSAFVQPSLLPGDERPSSHFETCSKTEPSFMNLTRSFFDQVIRFANTTALSALNEGQADLSRLSTWLQTKTLTTLPRVVEKLENVRSNWRLKFRSYLKRVGSALSSPIITGLTRSTNGTPSVVGKIKRQLKSAIKTISNVRWLRINEPDVCENDWTCDQLVPFADHLNQSALFRERISKKQVDSYVTFLKHIPKRQCQFNSTLMSCERCFWTGNCIKTKKACNVRRWQRQKRVDPVIFLAHDAEARQMLEKLGWIPSKVEQPCMPKEPLGPPRQSRRKPKESKKQTEETNADQPRCEKKRAEKRRPSNLPNSWFIRRHAQRQILRQSGRLSDWFLARGSHRAALRRN
ncbi:hypothetical protein M3Y96_00012900 [Aphelenchoides besseyi]|nr:hypothetical protein M3Y96_00012900 [Aphelenchoides besseyi]